METALTGLIVITLLLLSALLLSQSFIASQEIILESWREMEERLGEKARTDLSPIAAETKNMGATVEIVLKNDGDTKLADFDQWDVILEYTGSDSQDHTEWYPYGLGINKWTKTGIYLDASTATAEFFDTGILNPGEEIVIQVSLSPWAGSPTTNLATVATPNGISASTVFTY